MKKINKKIQKIKAHISIWKKYAELKNMWEEIVAAYYGKIYIIFVLQLLSCCLAVDVALPLC